MSKNFVNALKQEDNLTLTENGATALKSTYSSLVDLFGQIGSFRTRSNEEIELAFSKAFAEDKLLAMKIAYYARDIRFGGLGERRVAKVIYKFLAKSYPKIIEKNILNISKFGREDDIFCLLGTDCEDEILKYIKEKLERDCEEIGYAIPWRKS